MKAKSHALPPVPLYEYDLCDIEQHPDVVRVWVPVHRTETVHTRAGEYTFDVLKFCFETGTQFVCYRYTAPNDAHRAWSRSEPTPNDHPDGGFIEETLTDEYRILREAPP